MDMQAETEQRPWSQRTSYAVLREVCRMTGILALQVRCFGREHYPHTGGALVCANHQSNLDPPLVGMTCNRRMNYLAKQTLFRHQPLKWIIEHLDAIPIDKTGMGLGGIRETLKRLKRGELVLIFPEGQRTFDGEMTPLKPGFCAVARRTRVPLVPVGFDGAFQAWPRTRMTPRAASVSMFVGRPITQADYENISDDKLVELLTHRIRDCFERAKAHRSGRFWSFDSSATNAMRARPESDTQAQGLPLTVRATG